MTTRTFHDEIATDLEKRQQELNHRLKLLTGDNKDFQVTSSEDKRLSYILNDPL